MGKPWARATGSSAPPTTPTLDLAIGSSDNVDRRRSHQQPGREVPPDRHLHHQVGDARAAGNGQFTLAVRRRHLLRRQVYVVDRATAGSSDSTRPIPPPPTPQSTRAPPGSPTPTSASPSPRPSPPLAWLRVPPRLGRMGGLRLAQGILEPLRGLPHLEVRAVDAAGNPDPSPVVTHVDRGSRPRRDDDRLRPLRDRPMTPSPSFAFSSSEPGSSFECRLDSNQESDLQSCSSPKSYSSLADGAHTFEVRATDAVGNTDPTPASRSFTVDTTPPNTTIDPAPPGPPTTPRPSFTFSSSEPNSSFECRLDSNQEADFQQLQLAEVLQLAGRRRPHLRGPGHRRGRNTDPTPGLAQLHRRHHTAYGHGTRPAPPPRPNHDAGAGQLVRRRQPHHPGKPQVRPPETQL